MQKNDRTLDSSAMPRKPLPRNVHKKNAALISSRPYSALQAEPQHPEQGAEAAGAAVFFCPFSELVADGAVLSFE